MRTNVEIDDALMKEALEQGGLRTKRATIEEGLRLLIRLKGQTRDRDFDPFEQHLGLQVIRP